MALSPHPAAVHSVAAFPPVAEAAHLRPRTARAVAMAVALASFLLLLVLWQPLVEGYFPSNDELAIEASSLSAAGVDPARTWFTQGFHGLFEPYPEWGSPNTDYFRPLAQAMFRVHHEVLGERWGSQLVLGYATHAAVVGLIAYLSLVLLRLPVALAALATLAALLNPAFWSSNAESRFPISYVVQFPIFQTEITCGLLTLLAFMAFAARRFAVFAVLTFLALCLKENALTLPFTALMLAGAWSDSDRPRSLRRAALLLSPFLAWLACKSLVFDYGLAPAGAADPGGALGRLLHTGRDALYWPSAAYDASLRQSVDAARQGQWPLFLGHGLELALNLAWWLALAAAGRHALSHAGRHGFLQAPAPWAAALVFSFGNLGLFFLMQDTQLRHGYFWLALGPAALLGFLAQRPHGRVLGAVLVLGLVLPQIPSIARERSADALAKYRLLKDSSRALVATLAGLPPQVRTVYIVDDIVVQPSGPESLARFSGFAGKIVLVNSLDLLPGCPLVARDAIPPRALHRSDQGIDLDYAAPPTCFRWAWMVAPERELARGRVIERGSTMRYEFPELGRRPVSVSNTRFAYDVGRRWQLHVAASACPDAGQCRWFALDVATARYEELPQSAP